MKIFFIYKNGTYKFKKMKSIQPMEYNNSNIRMIGIPYTEKGNAYIPIKPSALYNFHEVKVNFLFAAASYFPMDNITDYIHEPESRTHTCYDIVSFINTIYNLYKMVSLSLTYLSDTDPGYLNEYSFWFSYPIRYIFTFYNKHGEVIDEIDSGELDDLAVILTNFTHEDWEVCPDGIDVLSHVKPLYQFLFRVGEKYMQDYKFYISDSVVELPGILSLKDDTWTNCSHNPIIGDNISLLVKIPIHNLFYLIDSVSYYQLSLLMKEKIEVYTTVHFVCNDTKLHDYIWPGLSTLSLSDKESYAEALLSGDIFPEISYMINITHPIELLSIYTMISSFVGLLYYFSMRIWNVSNEKDRLEIVRNEVEVDNIRLFTILTGHNEGIDINPENIIPHQDLNEDRFMESILNILLRKRKELTS